MKTLNNSQQIPQLVRDTARMEHRWPDSRVGYDRPLLMGKIDTIFFQSGKSQLADPGHMSIPGTNAVRDIHPPPPGISPIMKDNTMDTRQH